MLLHHSRDNNSSLFQSSLRLSSSLQQNITLRQAFPRSFSKPIWQEISRLRPREFLLQQEQILNALLNDQEKFMSFFRLFYNNHLVVYEWHVLASEKHLEIKDYVFTKLLKKTCAQYKTILKDNMNKLAKSSMKKQSSKHSNNNNKKYPANFFLRSTNHTPKPSSSQLTTPTNKSQSLPNSIHHSSVFPHTSHQPQSSQDYHQLFIKTLDACDGFKYIHYDFCRHQKGYENRNMYNRFIRGKKRRNNSCERLSTFYEELRDVEEGKEKAGRQGADRRRNVFNKTFSFLKLGAVHNGAKIAKFQLIPFDINEEKHVNNVGDTEKRRSHFKSQGSKTHMMKKMPHQFGKQKKSNFFMIKTQKSLVLIQPLRM